MGFEEYHYPANTTLYSSLSGRTYYEGSDGWTTELRSNFEEQGSVACSVGKAFAGEKSFSYSFTPSVGLVAGELQGLSIGLNASLAYKGLSLSSFIQQVSSFGTKKTGLIFSWWELNYKLMKHLNAGLVLQQTCFNYGSNSWDPGAQLSFSIGSWSFPVYLFKPANGQCYLVAGLCREWKIRKDRF